MKTAVRLFAVMVFAMSFSIDKGFAQTLFGSDEAGNYSSWTNGSNFGSKFGAWDVWTTGSGGRFLGNSSSQGFGNINSGNNTAFGMWANPSGTNQSYAQRFFSGTGSPETSGRAYLLPGMSFQVDLAVAFRNGNKGIRLKDQGFGDLFLFNVQSDQYRANGANLGWSYSQTSIFNLTVEQINTTQYRVKIIRGSDEYNSGNLTGVVSGFLLFIEGTDAGNDLNNLYSNNFEIYTGSHVELSTTINNSADFVLMSSPVATTYADILAEVWKQGATGANSTNGTANVWTWNNNSTTGASTNWTAISDFGSTVSSGSGFLYYHFNDDNFDATPNATTTALSVSGTENSDPSITVNPNTSGYTLVGNPFATGIDWDLFATKTNVNANAQLYDPSINNFITTASQDKIAPFQAFFVQTSSSSPALSIGNGAKTTGATFLGKEINTARLVEFKAAAEGVADFAVVSLDEMASFGTDRFDTEKLASFASDFLSIPLMDAEGNTFAVRSFPLIQDALEIPMDVVFPRGGSATISLSRNSLPAGFTVALRDNKTGSTLDVNGDFSYTFESAKSAKINPASSGPVFAKLSASSNPRFTLIVTPPSTTSAERTAIPSSVSLEQNFPNPFNPETTVSFTLGSASNVRLAVYDLNGRQVDVITTGMKAAGKHTFRWNAAVRASGVYMLRLEANGQTLTRKMSLLK